MPERLGNRLKEARTRLEKLIQRRMQIVDGEQRQTPRRQRQHFLHEAARKAGHSPKADQQHDSDIKPCHRREYLNLGQNPVNEIWQLG